MQGTHDVCTYLIHKVIHHNAHYIYVERVFVCASFFSTQIEQQPHDLINLRTRRLWGSIMKIYRESYVILFLELRKLNESYRMYLQFQLCWPEKGVYICTLHVFNRSTCSMDAFYIFNSIDVVLILSFINLYLLFQFLFFAPFQSTRKVAHP